MAFCKCYSLSFIRSVENGLEPSHTYDEVKKNLTMPENVRVYSKSFH